MTSIIYSKNGQVIFTMGGSQAWGSVGCIECDVPDGCYVESVNPETGVPVLKENPKTEEQQKIADLEAKQAEDDERYVDQEYRLTLMELGLTE